MLNLVLLRLRQLRPQSNDQKLLGGLELITPTLLSGWVYLPSASYGVVKLLIGPHLIAQAFINRARPDVEAHLGISGCFGFEIVITDDFPLVEFDLEPNVVAFADNGNHSVKLSLFKKKKAKLTTHVLRAALHPNRRGLHGHFDGLNPSGDALHGWSFQVGRKQVSIWMHADGLPSKELTCDQNRSDVSMNGLTGNCGFYMSLCSWPEAQGKVVWTSFDECGLLILPQQQTIQLLGF